MNNKNFEKLYQDTFSKVHASDELLSKVKNISKDNKTVKFDFKIISAVAACLVVAILSVFIINPFGSNENTFVLKAGAAEIGGDSAVAIASVNPFYSGAGGGKESLTIPFTVYCDGDNIESVKYTVENAVFIFPYEDYDIEITEWAKDWRTMYPKAAELSDKDYDKVLAEIKVDNGFIEAPQYSGYTLSCEEQKELEKYDDMQSFPIHISADISTEGYVFTWADYFDWDRDLSELNEDEELFNKMVSMYLEEMQVLYNDMYDKVRINIEVTYEDGTTESETFKLSCIRANEEEGFVIGARIVNE